MNRGYSRQFLILLGAGGILLALFLFLYISAMSAVTPTRMPADPRGSGESLTVRTVRLAGQNIRVEVADTPASREQGLSGRAGLGPDEGMLFVFPMEGNYAFWMKDMRFSIDILWLSSDGTVIHIEHAVSPDTYPRSFASGSPARYVLELPAGWAKAYTVHVGDAVSL